MEYEMKSGGYMGFIDGLIRVWYRVLQIDSKVASVI